MPAFSLPVGAAYVVIIALTGMIWSILVWNIRLFVRTNIRGPFGSDNIHCTIATVLGVLNSSITIVEAHYGMGLHTNDIPAAKLHRQQLLTWIAAQFYVLALCFANLSVCFLILRIFRRTNRAWLPHTIAVVTSVWAVVAFFLVVFMCRLPRPWLTMPSSRCINIYHSWIGIAIVNTLLDLANIVAAVVLLWRVRMPWRTRALVVTLFALRLFTIPPTLTRLQYIEKALSARDWSYARIEVIIITQVVLHLSIILASLPCIKPYMNAFKTGALHAPTVNIRRASKPPGRRSRSPAPLPLTQPRPTLKRQGMSTGISSIRSIRYASSRAGHSESVQAWSLRTCANTTSSVTTVEYDPKEAKEAERRRSKDSASSKGIIRKQSFSVKFDNVEDSTMDGATGSCCGRGSGRTNIFLLELEEAGRLLTTVPKEKEKQRNGSHGADLSLETYPDTDQSIR